MASLILRTAQRQKNKEKIKNRVAQKKQSRQRSVEAVREEEVKLLLRVNVSFILRFSLNLRHCYFTPITFTLLCLMLMLVLLIAPIIATLISRCSSENRYLLGINYKHYCHFLTAVNHGVCHQIILHRYCVICILCYMYCRKIK